MITVAVYCRVSTDTQEREGTSLETQLEGCLRRCEDKGYDAAHRLSEACSGLTLERPKLNELRELVRAERLPKVCPKCNSPYWNKPKMKQSGPQRKVQQGAELCDDDACGSDDTDKPCG